MWNDIYDIYIYIYIYIYEQYAHGIRAPIVMNINELTRIPQERQYKHDTTDPHTFIHHSSMCKCCLDGLV